MQVVFDGYRKKRIVKRDALLWLAFVFLTFPCLNPEYFNHVASIELLINGWRLGAFAIILFITLFIRKKLSIVVILIGIIQVYLIVNTLIHGGDLYGCVVNACSIMSVVIIYDYGLNSDKQRCFYSSQLFCFEVVIYINFITELLYPNGMYTGGKTLFISNKYWFLGYYNNHSQFFIPALLIAFLYMFHTGKKIRTYILTVTIFISAILLWAGGVLVALFSMLGVYLVLKNRTKIVNFYTCWLIHIVFFVTIILLKMQNLFRWLIDDILGKWHTLELRMNLWEWYMKTIEQSPIIGYGAENGIVREIKSGFYWGLHAHNQLLEVLYQGGVIYVILFIVLIICAGKKVYKNKHSLESKIITTAFVGWCMHSLVEPFTTPFLMGMFVVAFYSNNESILYREEKQIKE